jgi:hypothetical protein
LSNVSATQDGVKQRLTNENGNFDNHSTDETTKTTTVVVNPSTFPSTNGKTSESSKIDSNTDPYGLLRFWMKLCEDLRQLDEMKFMNPRALPGRAYMPTEVSET